MPSLNRVVMGRSSRAMIRALDPARLHVAEISGSWGKMFDFASYEQFNFPEYDVCQTPFLDAAGNIRQFDLILANQVWEHLDRPFEATLNVHEMLRPGGHFWLAVPFFVPFHAAPNDCSRWSARGLRNLLVECGFAPDAIRAEQWGNKHAALRNLEDRWPPQYNAETDPLDNDPNMPICAWAIAQKT